MMRSVESCMANVIKASRPPREICTSINASVTSISTDLDRHAPDADGRAFAPSQTPMPSSAGPSSSGAQQRKASWAWDQQLQSDLEQTFEQLRTFRRVEPSGDSPEGSRHELTNSRTAESAFPAPSHVDPESPEWTRRNLSKSSPAATPEAERRFRMARSASMLADSLESSQIATSTPSLSASGVIGKWMQAKKSQHIGDVTQSTRDFAKAMKTFSAGLTGPRSRKRLIDRLVDGSPKLSPAVLRSSWLFRQRAAGRLTRREVRQQPCGLLCGFHICMHMGILSPNSLVCTLFDMLNAFAVAYVATFTPLQVAFYEYFDGMPWRVTNVSVEILFMLGILLRFRRGFNYDGVPVFDPQFIALHYMRGEFVADAIASFP